MKKELIQDFVLRTSQASRSELIVILYDIILEDIQAARCFFSDEGKHLPAEKRKETAKFRKELKHAQRAVNELMAALDFQYRLSFELRRLYVFANQELIRAERSNTLEPLLIVEQMISKLKAAFIEVAKQDTSGPMVQNAQHLTAGLTYGKSRLNEVFIEGNDPNRGFTA